MHDVHACRHHHDQTIVHAISAGCHLSEMTETEAADSRALCCRRKHGMAGIVTREGRGGEGHSTGALYQVLPA